MNTTEHQGIITGFTPLKTHHCVTGSMRNIFEYYGYQILEEVLFGLGCGIGFGYLEIKGTIPFVGGRANVGRAGEDGLEITAAKRTGVEVRRYTTSSVKKAETRLLELINDKKPVMLYVDMGFLPYFNLPPETHFGAHMVVIAGYDPNTSRVFVADRDGKLHPVSLSYLAQARNSKFKPFPPKNAWFEWDFSNAHEIKPDDVKRSIFETADKMINPPISNLGCKGIYKAAQRIKNWHQILDNNSLRAACFNGYIYIDATGGTGGGLFRYMYSRFLHEAVTYTGISRLEDISIKFKNIGNRWQEVALAFKEAAESSNPPDFLKDIGTNILMIAEMEKAAWEQLFDTMKR